MLVKNVSLLEFTFSFPYVATTIVIKMLQRHSNFDVPKGTSTFLVVCLTLQLNLRALISIKGLNWRY